MALAASYRIKLCRPQYVFLDFTGFFFYSFDRYWKRTSFLILKKNCLRQNRTPLFFLYQSRIFCRTCLFPTSSPAIYTFVIWRVFVLKFIYSPLLPELLHYKPVRHVSRSLHLNDETAKILCLNNKEGNHLSFGRIVTRIDVCRLQPTRILVIARNLHRESRVLNEVRFSYRSKTMGLKIAASEIFEIQQVTAKIMIALLVIFILCSPVEQNILERFALM